uniref:Uncharacterized protein n=1 Tax=Glossina palpalis gambiensis TaxID=67801 RepID=A0A1B0BCM7_9MUSC
MLTPVSLSPSIKARIIVPNSTSVVNLMLRSLVSCSISATLDLPFTLVDISVKMIGLFPLPSSLARLSEKSDELVRLKAAYRNKGLTYERNY